jgi:thiol-disulfide isomerase/thioredoxin
MGLLGAGILVLFVAAGIALAVTDEPASEQTETAAVQISGDVLSAIPREPGAQDEAIGLAAPGASGSSFTGGSVDLLNDDGGTVVVFLAHWCNVCQGEVPVIVDTLTPDNLPENVRVVAVPTGTSNLQPNYPPSAWLEREEWPFPLLVDSAEFDLASAYGVGAYPAFVVVGPDGDVRFRVTGALEPEQLQQLVQMAAQA